MPHVTLTRRFVLTCLLTVLVSLIGLLPTQPAFADATTTDRYRVYTYGFLGKEPYQKSASEDLASALSSYNTAADFNYTSVLFDAADLALVKTYRSSAAAKGDSVQKVTPILDQFQGGTTAEAVAIANQALTTLGDAGDPLAKAIKLALQDFVAETSPFVSSSPKYDNEQIVFILSWLSNAASNDSGTQNQLQRKLEERVNGALSDPKVQEYIGSWEVVWGPVVYERPQSVVVNNTLYVARKGNQYVIATAGTNPLSFYDWWVEDLDVSTQVQWPYRKYIPTGLDPKIAQGTRFGLGFLLEMSSGGQTLLDFLSDVMTDAEQEIDLVVAGHSLGGALSPTLALALLDQQDQWAHDHPFTISVEPSAGPTPGDADFATYYDQRLRNTTTRIWNEIDIVPRAWEEDLLKPIPTLYEPQIKPNWLIETLVQQAELNAAQGNYQQLVPYTAPLKGKVDVHPHTPTCQPANRAGLELAVDPSQPLDLDAVAEQIATHLKPGLTQLIKEKPEAAAQLLVISGASPQGGMELLQQSPESFNLSAYTWLKGQIKGLLTFFSQVGYQHTTEYSHLLGIDELTTYMAQQCYTGDNLSKWSIFTDSALAAIEKRICQLIYDATGTCLCGGC